jgi:hypothetical protein
LSPYYFLDIQNNFAMDDQPISKTKNLVAFENASTQQHPNVNPCAFVMCGNAIGEGVANVVTGLAEGYWLVNNGIVQEWAGYGSPDGVVLASAGSLYQRLDGGVSTTFYVKETGTGKTGWVGYGATGAASNGIGGDYSSVVALLSYDDMTRRYLLQQEGRRERGQGLVPRTLIFIGRPQTLLTKSRLGRQTRLRRAMD